MWSPTKLLEKPNCHWRQLQDPCKCVHFALREPAPVQGEQGRQEESLGIRPGAQVATTFLSCRTRQSPLPCRCCRPRTWTALVTSPASSVLQAPACACLPHPEWPGQEDQTPQAKVRARDPGPSPDGAECQDTAHPLKQWLVGWDETHIIYAP